MMALRRTQGVRLYVVAVVSAASFGVHSRDDGLLGSTNINEVAVINFVLNVVSTSAHCLIGCCVLPKQVWG